MSTKVYEAYKLNSGFDLLPIMYEIRKTAFDNLEKSVEEHWVRLYKRYPEKFAKDRDFSPFEIHLFLGSLYREAAAGSSTSPHDFDTSLTIREKEGSYYFIPYSGGGCRNVWNFLENHEAFSFYGYWDNTDPDERCSEEEWEERGKIWYYFCDRWEDYLLLEVLTVHGFYKLAPLDRERHDRFIEKIK